MELRFPISLEPEWMGWFFTVTRARGRIFKSSKEPHSTSFGSMMSEAAFQFLHGPLHGRIFFIVSWSPSTLLLENRPSEGVRVATMTQRVVEHRNLDDVSASGAANADAPTVIEFCDLLVVEPEFIDAVRAIEQSHTCSRFGIRRQRRLLWRRGTGTRLYDRHD